MVIIKEHQKLDNFGKLDPDNWSDQYKDGYVLNPHASAYDKRYFFTWNTYYDTPCYTASYVIGAQRIDGEEMIVQPKMDNIDFMRMFSVCLSNNLSPELFSKIYDIDIDAEPIKVKTKISASLTPLLIVHFLMIMKRITARGLRSDYVDRN